MEELHLPLFSWPEFGLNLINPIYSELILILILYINLNSENKTL